MFLFRIKSKRYFVAGWGSGRIDRSVVTTQLHHLLSLPLKCPQIYVLVSYCTGLEHPLSCQMLFCLLRKYHLCTYCEVKFLPFIVSFLRRQESRKTKEKTGFPLKNCGNDGNISGVLLLMVSLVTCPIIIFT